MGYQFEFRPYRRQFARSLFTSHGIWDIREGIILRLTDEFGQMGWGEIAPLPWFGSETLDQALEFCRQLPSEITTETIFSIPAGLPACQFGFESAWEALNPLPPCHQNPQSKIENRKSKIAYSGLLPTGEAALQQWQTLWHQGYHTFKWKIGVAPIQEELKIFHQLIEALPISAKLRLDANGGLSWQEAEKWLYECDRTNNIEFLATNKDRPNPPSPPSLVGKGGVLLPSPCRRGVGGEVRPRLIVEFLEQPLPANQVNAMLDLSRRYFTPIALDESVATIDQMQACYQQGWRGIFVIKPCIAGYPSRLRQFCQENNIDAVFSSVFETAIGRHSAIKFSAELNRHNRAIGFGVNHWFNEDDVTWLERLWNNH